MAGEGDAQDAERAALRQERDRLARERNALSAEAARLEHSRDIAAMRRLHTRLQQYGEDLNAYRAALAAFHARFGPLDR
jgi:seryl-tRNA synthetase